MAGALITTPTPLSPITYTGNGQPTLPQGSVVDYGQGPKVATSMGLVNQPGAAGLQTPAPTNDQTFSRIAAPFQSGKDTFSATDPRFTLGTNNDPNTQKAVDLATTIRNMQGAVDNVNQAYDKKIADYGSGQGNANEGQTRASAGMLGLAGSTSATAKEQGTGKVNQANTDAINQERSQKINQIYGQMDQAQSDFNTAMATNNAATQKQASANAETQATTLIQSFAKTLGDASFSQFRDADPQTYGRLLDMFGGNVDKMKLAYNAAGATPVTYDTKSVPGYAIYADPKTGEIHSLKIDTPSGYDMQVAPDGTPILFNKETGDLKIAPGFEKGSLAKPVPPSLKYTTIGTDKFGDNVYGFVDETNGKVVSGGQGGGSASSGGAEAPAVPNADYSSFLTNKTPQQASAFNVLSDQEKQNVMGLLNGDILLSDIAKGGIKGSKAAQTYFADARRIDPTFSENVNKSRYQFLKDWNDPQQKSFQNRVTINTALGHIAELKDAVGQLSNVQGLNMANSFKNIISQETGNPNVPDFNMIMTALASEYAGLYKGASPTDPEIEAWKNTIESNYSPATLSQLIDRGTKLAGDRLNSITNEYNNSMGKYPTDPIVQPDALAKLQTSGVDTSGLEKVMAKSQPIGSTFQFNGHTVKKTGDDSYEVVETPTP